MISKRNKLYSALGHTKVFDKLSHTWYGIIIVDLVKYILSRDYLHRKLKIINKGSIRINKWIIGNGNKMYIGKNACLNVVYIKILGYNNRIIIGDKTIIGKRCRIYLFGNDLELNIGEGCTFSHDDEILVQEDCSKIIIGNDCQFSHHINLRTSDAHPLYFVDSGERANKPKNIYIGNHVWVGANVIIQKGSMVGNGCVVATYSVVNDRINPKYGNTSEIKNMDANFEGIKDFNNVVIAGIPAKVVKKNICWQRNFM